MSSLPIGWENRSNSMSEKDMKLGGIAATKFIDKSLSNSGSSSSSSSNLPENNSYSKTTSGVYQNSDQVREHYLRQIEQQNQQQQKKQAHDDSLFASGNRHGSQGSTPMLWEERQQMRKLEAEGFRSQDTKTSTGMKTSSLASSPQPISSTSSKSTIPSAHGALVKVATHTLDSLADVLENDTNAVEISMEDRAAFAKAIQRAMQALAAAKK